MSKKNAVWSNMFLFLMVVALMSGGALAQTDIPLVNGDFALPDIATDTTSTTPPSDWEVITWDPNIWLQDDVEFPADHQQVIKAASGVGRLGQTSAEVITAGMVYTGRFFHSNIKDGRASLYLLGVDGGGTATPIIDTGELASGTSWNVLVGRSVSFAADDYPAMIGQLLRVEVVARGNAGSADNGSRCWIDTVSLEKEVYSVPDILKNGSFSAPDVPTGQVSTLPPDDWEGLTWTVGFGGVWLQDNGTYPSADQQGVKAYTGLARLGQTTAETITAGMVYTGRFWHNNLFNGTGRASLYLMGDDGNGTVTPIIDTGELASGGSWVESSVSFAADDYPTMIGQLLRVEVVADGKTAYSFIDAVSVDIFEKVAIVDAGPDLETTTDIAVPIDPNIIWVSTPGTPAWTVVDSPVGSTVTFAPSASVENVSVTCDLPGSLTLQLQADGISDTVVITVYTPICGDLWHPAPQGDLNKDCVVDTTDLEKISQKWLFDQSLLSVATLPGKDDPDETRRGNSNWGIRKYYEQSAVVSIPLVNGSFSSPNIGSGTVSTFAPSDWDVVTWTPDIWLQDHASFPADKQAIKATTGVGRLGQTSAEVITAGMVYTGRFFHTNFNSAGRASLYLMGVDSADANNVTPIVDTGELDSNTSWNTFVEGSVSFNADDYPAMIGQLLRVEVVVKGNSAYCWIDNVRLEKNVFGAAPVNWEIGMSSQRYQSGGDVRTKSIGWDYNDGDREGVDLAFAPSDDFVSITLDSATGTVACNSYDWGQDVYPAGGTEPAIVATSTFNGSFTDTSLIGYRGVGLTYDAISGEFVCSFVNSTGNLKVRSLAIPTEFSGTISFDATVDSGMEGTDVAINPLSGKIVVGTIGGLNSSPTIDTFERDGTAVRSWSTASSNLLYSSQGRTFYGLGMDFDDDRNSDKDGDGDIDSDDLRLITFGVADDYILLESYLYQNGMPLNGINWGSLSDGGSHGGGYVFTPIQLPVGDCDGDYKVDIVDFACLAAHWLECTAPSCP